MLSVIVPLYQNAATIRRCITSIGDGCEIVVVDDGSTDEGAAEAASFPYVRLLHQEHQGAAAARNRGIEAATGEYLWFVDADDVLLPGAISAAEEALREHKPDLFKMGRLVDTTRSQEALDVPCPALTRQVPLADIYGQDKGTLDHTTFLFSRQYLLSHGLRYPEGMTILED